MRRRISSFAVLVTAAALAAPAIVQAAPAAYTDPTGDNGGAADIGAVTIDLASDGYLHIKAAIANMPVISAGDVILVLDTDRSGSTGSILGGDYIVLVDLADLSGLLIKWGGSDYAPAPVQSGDVRYLVGGGIEFLLRPAAIGGATAFNFILAASTGDGDQALRDFAPNNGSWFFEVQKPAPAPTPAVATSAKPAYAPATPRAGRPFRITGATVGLDDGSSAPAETFRCRATLGGKVLRGTGSGACTFAVPKTAKGKRLVVMVAATYAGRTVSSGARAFRVG